MQKTRIPVQRHARTYLPLLPESDAVGGAGEEGGASPGDECDEELSFAGSLCQRECCPSSVMCRCVREVSLSPLADPAGQRTATLAL